MIKLKPVLANQLRFVIIFLLLITLALIIEGRNSASIRAESREVEKHNQELRETNKKLQDQDKLLEQKLKKLEKQVKEIKIVKARRAEEIRLAVAYQKPQVRFLSTNNTQVLKLIYSVWWEDARFHDLIMCESGYNNWADGYDAAYNQHNYGLFQVADNHGYSREQLADPVFNIKVAKQIWDARKAQRGVAWAWYAWPTCSKQAGFI